MMRTFRTRLWLFLCFLLVTTADITLAEVDETQQVRSDNLKTAALVWHSSSPWVDAVTRGATDVFNRFNVKVVAITDADYDPIKQLADLENVAMLKPAIVLSLSVDNKTTVSGYQRMLNKGTKLVLLSNPVSGVQSHPNYLGLVSVDSRAMGRSAAALMAELLPSSGRVGIIFHDANYAVTNQRDSAFLQALSEHERLTVVAKKGFIKEQDTSVITMAMLLQHPDIDAIYVSWEKAAEGVLEALRSQGAQHVKVISHDLGVNTLLDMAQSRNMHGVISDRPYEIGMAMALNALEIGSEEEHFAELTNYDVVTINNIAHAWSRAFRIPLPFEITRRLMGSN